MLVVFEGLDRMGKSTLIPEVAKAFKCQVTKEPGSPLVEANKEIRKLVLDNHTLSPMQRELLFYADALGHKQVLKTLEGLVLSDRGIWSHFAYLYGYMKTKMLGDDPDENYSRYSACRNLIKLTCPTPDAIVYLKGDLALMEERARGAKDAIEALPPTFFNSVINFYEVLVTEANLEGLPLLMLDAKSSVIENAAKTVEFLGNLQTIKI